MLTLSYVHDYVNNCTIYNYTIRSYKFMSGCYNYKLQVYEWVLQLEVTSYKFTFRSYWFILSSCSCLCYLSYAHFPFTIQYAKYNLQVSIRIRSYNLIRFRNYKTTNS